MKHSLFVLAIISLVSCNNKPETEENDIPVVVAAPNTIDNSATIDTTILLTDITNSGYQGLNLNDSIAKNTLYTYFESKGYDNTSNLPPAEKLNDADKNKLYVDFKNIFVTNLNGNQHQDAIITYWITPPYVSGHCWQPHKAIILDTDKGYVITNEDFIPDNFAIDSVTNHEGKTTIYGYDYDCANLKKLKQIKARLK